MARIDASLLDRWRRAHDGEAEFWLALPEDVLTAQVEGYARLAGQIHKHYRTFVAPTGSLRVLQIGCAVEDAVFHFPEGELHAVDPLAHLYKEHFERARNERVSYRTAMGEDLPYQARFFNVVICNNVLDHCADYRMVMTEITRVLADSHVVFFGTDVYPKNVAESRLAMEAQGASLDVNHPHTFTKDGFDRLLAEFGLQSVDSWPPQESGKGDSSWRYCLLARRTALDALNE